MAPLNSPLCPSPSPCRRPAPTGSWLLRHPCTRRPHQTPITSSSHLAVTPASSTRPHTTPLPLFGYAPKASLHLPGPSPRLPAPTPRTQTRRCTPSSWLLALAPSALSEFVRPSFSFLAPVHFPLTLLPNAPPPTTRPPSPNGSSPSTRSRPSSPARPPPSRRWCGCCSWKGTVALSGCSPARGEPAGTGGEQPRRSPPVPPRPGPQAPPPLPPAAAPAIARPAACLPRPHSEPRTAPNPRCGCLSALRGGDRPP